MHAIGRISFPLLNDLQAANRTPLELKRDIQKQLKRYISNPAVTVSVTKTKIPTFYILGEVKKTGEYKLERPLTIFQAFALAGGFTDWAKKSEIKLIRRIDGKDNIIRIDYKKIVRGGDLSKNINLRPGDTILVP